MNKCKILAIVNQKGGVGKTTTAVNLAAALSALQEKILLIDADPQANASSAFGLKLKHSSCSLYAVMQDNNLLNRIIHTFVPNLDIIIGHEDLYGLDMELAEDKQKHLKFVNMLKNVKHLYKYIIIDCPPGLGVLSLNALVASEIVLIPVQCEYYALEGLVQVYKTINLVKTYYNPHLIIDGLLLTMYDKRSLLADQVVEDVRSNLPALVYNTVIPRNTKIAEAPSHGRPVLFYDVKSPGAASYIRFAREFIERNAKERARDNVNWAR